ncbi:MAG: substrate-binding domain-containing protein [Nitrospirota bacterium]|jgi:hypothetical protein
MLHRTLTTALGTVAALAMAAPAFAVVDVELNLTGASAQFKFFNESAPSWMQAPVASHGLGCASADGSAVDAGGHYGISIGYDCDALGGAGHDIIFRYTSKASYDGILSLLGDDSQAGPSDLCTAGDLTAAQAALEPDPGYYRKMADENNTNFTTNVVNGTICKDIHLGASDVAGETFVQSSHGAKYGHLGGAQTDRTFNGIDASSLDHYNPLVVPFGAFVNADALPAVDNLTRLKIVLIYSGNIELWSDFGPGWPAKRVIVCLRHAGSGTHATIDAAVMRGDWSLVTNEVLPGPAALFHQPVVYFNDSSSDMMRCVDQNGGQSTATHGAVGYADADTCVGQHVAGGKCEHVNEVAYQGEFGFHNEIVYCDYPWWSAQWLYEDPNEPVYATTHPIVLELVDFMSDGGNLATFLPAKYAYWAARAEMHCEKSNDFAYPKQP